MDTLLTIGITTHGNKISEKIIQFLLNKPIQIIVSEDLEDKSSNLPDYITRLYSFNKNVKYIFSHKQGIANNRQNILDVVTTKYLYTIDHDDLLEANFWMLNEFLDNSNYDVLYVKCYEDGEYIRIPHNFIYMCTWMQIFNVDWLRKYGGYVQSWNFIHEECATNLNLIANLRGSTYKRCILKKELVCYKYHANNACNINFDVKSVCDFVRSIPFNNKIQNKLTFIELFKQFTQKYMPVYRIKDGVVTKLSKIENGNFEDILKTIQSVHKELLMEKNK